MTTQDYQTEGDRVHKVLADLGYGSRREIETWISMGRISINGEVATLGDCVGEHDEIHVDGRLVKNHSEQAQNKRRVIMYHKPEGEICTRRDPHGRKTIFAPLPRLRKGRWVAVGRLDINTSGLLLFTNDGDLAHRLMHPSSEIEREYACRIFGDVDNDALQRLLQGVELDDGMAKFTNIREAGGDGCNVWFNVVVKEGRNREVRRLWESQGAQVSRLIRVRFGHLKLPRFLRRGQFQELSDFEVNAVANSVGMDEKDGGVRGGGQSGGATFVTNEELLRREGFIDTPEKETPEKHVAEKNIPEKSIPEKNAHEDDEKQPEFLNQQKEPSYDSDSQLNYNLDDNGSVVQDKKQNTSYPSNRHRGQSRDNGRPQRSRQYGGRDQSQHTSHTTNTQHTQHNQYGQPFRNEDSVGSYYRQNQQEGSSDQQQPAGHELLGESKENREGGDYEQKNQGRKTRLYRRNRRKN